MHTSLFRRVRGFTLIEVILGSMIIAGFVAGTVFIGSQLGEARIGSLAERDRSSWANLQSQLAAQGIDASSENSAIWTDKDFDAVGTATNDTLKLDSKTHSITGKQYGEAVVIRPFRVDVSSLAMRTNLNTVGFMIMDHETATGTPGTLDKPTGDPFSIGATFRLLAYDKATNTWSLGDVDLGTDGAASVTLDAWNDLDWESGAEPAIYLVAKPSGEGLDAVRVSTSGVPANTSSPYLGNYGTLPAGFTLPDGWTIGGALDPNALVGSSDQLEVSYVAEHSGVSSSAKSFVINVTKVTPYVDMGMENLDGTPRATNDVYLTDVVHSVITVSTSDIEAMNAGLMSVRLYGSEEFEEENKLPGVLDSYITVSQTIGTKTGGISGSVSAGFRQYATANSFVSNAPHTWTIQVNSTSPFVKDTTASETLTAVAETLPEIVMVPYGTPYVFSSPSVVVSLTPTPELAIPGVNDEDLYDVRFTTDGKDVTQISNEYTGPFRLGSWITYETSLELRAKAFNRKTDLGVFLHEREEPSYAAYRKETSHDSGDWWDYGSFADGIMNDDVQRQKWSDTVHKNNSSIASSWKSGVVPDKYEEGDPEYNANMPDRNVFFASVCPDNSEVYVDGSYTVGGIFFDNPEKSFTLAKPSSGSSINLLREEEDNVEITVVSGQDHIVNSAIYINQPIVVNTQASDTGVAISEISKARYSSDGVYKTGSGVLTLLASSSVSNPSGDEANEKHQIRYVVEEGTLRLGTDNTVNYVSDDAGQAGIVMDGGTLDLNGKDQSFEDGVFTVTAPAKLMFGEGLGGSELTSQNVSINDLGRLRIYNYSYPVSGDHFYSKYPGLATLRRIIYPTLYSVFKVPSSTIISARWIGTSTSKMGEIVPRRPPTSTGIAYVTVAENSRIFFEGTSRLGTQDINVFDGCVLEIRNWSAGDVLTVELDDPNDPDNLFTVDECVSSTDVSVNKIKFYDDAGNLLGGGKAILVKYNVERLTAEVGKQYPTICKIVPYLP
ncbi:MAG: hypothetical protein JW942_01410 [Opitutales bacterium]|nr:hypothetical protein [Opitutales bacterium]